MSAFDTQITLGGLNVSLVQDSDDGPVYTAELGLLVALPVAPGQAILLGQIRTLMPIEAVDDAIEKLTAARAQMSKKSDIAVANSLEGIDKVAQHQQSLRG